MSNVCEVCSYETDDLSNFSRHKKSKKHVTHIKNIEDLECITKENFKCKFCDKDFTVKCNLYRHQKHYCKGKRNQILENQELRKENERLLEILEEKEKERIVNKKNIPKTIRAQVWEKYIGLENGYGECFCCKNEIKQIHFECGHTISKSNGGKNAVDNLRPICSLCNKSMGTRNMNEFIGTYFKSSIK